ncbi:sigma-70 family RNA polymerase sigma factor [Paenibacillus sophorae]|nr:sigma-70 family RNA polymerase sigma factor [Paenibacillus sophorae]
MVEKGFSIYIKLCLQHARRDYFKKLYRDSFYVRSYDEVAFETNIINFRTSTTVSIEDSSALSQAIEILNSSEKKVLFLKYYQCKTDKEIAEFIGVSRQAITKSRKKVLVKLKSHLEIH